MLLTIPEIDHPRLVHGFSTVALGSVAARDADHAAARRRLVSAAGLGEAELTIAGAVHGTAVVRVDRPLGVVPEVDGLVTDRPGVTLFATFADCHPILLHDPVGGAVGVAHAGWRGAAAGIATVAVRAMVEMGSQPEDLVIGLGPGICAYCYEVGDEVAAQFPSRVVAPSPAGRYLLDIAAANRLRLIEAGVRPDRIHAAGVCTFESQLLPSHRRSPDGTRFGAVIALRP